MCLKEMGKTKKEHPGQESNLGPPKYKAGILNSEALVVPT
jgi:hypothetical protein